MRVISVRFQPTGKLYYFDPGEFDVQINGSVVVETEQGLEMACVIVPPHEIGDDQVFGTIKPIIRIATQKDHETVQANQARQEEAMRICHEKIQNHQLEMHLVRAEYAFSGNKLTFFFTADGRVDFRELVKDLAGVFKVRIELRQIGVRDEARMIGGLGACGREVCCKSFLRDFHPVSIKMAKEQSLSLNPTKISGICGRLMCCLQYEQDCYTETRKRMPKIGKMVTTPDGVGVVIDHHIVTECVKVRMRLKDDTFEMKEFPLAEVSEMAAPEKPKHNMDMSIQGTGEGNES